ncbi:TPA: hypothetical protein I7764_11265 [Vibrio vulnificus]|nr:hypothetical protein [Vibrio vulnificus]
MFACIYVYRSFERFVNKKLRFFYREGYAYAHILGSRSHFQDLKSQHFDLLSKMALENSLT